MRIVTDVDDLPLADARRQLTVDRIRIAACELIMAQGLDVTMDELAAAAGVARRTLFRHFDSREKLLAAALDDGIRRYGDHLPAFDGDWLAWLRALCDVTHQMHASYGPGYWELMHRSDLPPELAEIEAGRRARRRQAMTRIARKLWRESGGAGQPPPAIDAVVAAHLSARFTVAVTDDAEQPWQVAADLAFDAISTALRAATPS